MFFKMFHNSKSELNYFPYYGPKIIMKKQEFTFNFLFSMTDQSKQFLVGGRASPVCELLLAFIAGPKIKLLYFEMSTVKLICYDYAAECHHGK